MVAVEGVGITSSFAIIGEPDSIFVSKFHTMLKKPESEAGRWIRAKPRAGVFA